MGVYAAMLMKYLFALIQFQCQRVEMGADVQTLTKIVDSLGCEFDGEHHRRLRVLADIQLPNSSELCVG